MTKTILFAGAAAMIFSAGNAAAGYFAKPAMMSHAIGRMVISGKGETLYDQTEAIGMQGIDSQNFESSFDAYDSQASDDFTVPAGATWTVTEVDAPGVYFNGSGPARSVNVVFEHAINTKGTGGTIVASFNEVVPIDNSGSFTIPLGKGVKLKGGTKGKRYSLLVIANCDFGTCGEWGWSTSTVMHGSPALWENPGGGFGVCPTWDTLPNCIEGDLDPDLSFALRGKSKRQ